MDFRLLNANFNISPSPCPPTKKMSLSLFCHSHPSVSLSLPFNTLAQVSLSSPTLPLFHFSLSREVIRSSPLLFAPTSCPHQLHQLHLNTKRKIETKSLHTTHTPPCNEALRGFANFLVPFLFNRSEQILLHIFVYLLDNRPLVGQAKGQNTFLGGLVERCPVCGERV